MNRELKFRIWDKQNKTWLDNSCSLHCFSNWSICPFTGKLIDYVGAIDGDHGDKYTASPAPDYYMQDEKIVKDSRYVIQQYTGLQDKNGTPIYEGDIAKIYNTDANTGEDNSSIFEVYFDQSFCQFRLKRHTSSYTMSSVEIYCEIIGNIFETPELLK